MLSLQQLYNSDFPYLNKNAIMLGDENAILDCRTYKQVIDLGKIITENIYKHVKDKCSCLGLVMNHNIYIPSIILSLQALQKSFIFLTPSNFGHVIDTLKINWFLSFDQLPSELLLEIHRFQIERKFVIIWKQRKYVELNCDFKNIFCVVQTSGTTGRNKNIRVTHNSIEHNAISLRNIFKTNHEDLIFWGTPLSFDPTLIELLISLQSGACLLIVPVHTYMNPVALYKALFCVSNITTLQMVPSVFLRWKENYVKMVLANNKLKILSLGGELFPKSILNYKRRKSLRLFNVYGITEVSCWASIHEIEDKSTENNISIGHCLENTKIEIRNQNGEVVNKEVGEIFIGSSSRICYVDDEIPNSHDKMIFRGTGDLGIINEKGIFYVGRKRNIIKRFGQKIHLNKIEEIIYNETGLDNKCIWSQKQHKIMSFILLNDIFESSNEERILDKIRVKIINILPENSIPDYFKIVESFPLTCHGKIDEKALENLYNSNIEGDSKSEVIFMSLVCKYLGLNSDDLYLQQCSYFEIGGNSITALQVLREFEEIMKCKYPDELVKQLFGGKLVDCLECLKQFEGAKLLENNISVAPSKKQKLCDMKLNISWTYNLKACVDGSPTVFEKNGRVLIAVGSFSHIFVVLSIDGEEIYKLTLPDSIECKPLVSQSHDYIYVGCFNGIMYCVDYETKIICWEYKTNDRIKSSPCFCKYQSAIVFGSYDQNIYCLSEEGSEFWKTKLEGSISSSPLIDDIFGNIFITTIKGNCYCIENLKGGIKWKYSSNIPIFGSPCLSNENTQIISATVRGKLFCLCSRSGKLLWRFEADGFIFSSLVSFKTYVIFGCHDKNIYIFENLPFSYKLIDKIQMASEISTTPFLHETNTTINIITSCNSGTVSIINLDSLTVTNSVKLPKEIFSSPVVYKDKIFVGCRDNNLYCLSE